MDRRHFIVGTAVASTAAVFALKPSNAGAPYTAYFSQLNQTLKSDGPGKPALLIDLDRLDANIQALKSLIPKEIGYRIAVKSIPSPEMIKYVMEKAQTDRLMVFHQPFLNHVAQAFPKTDVLMGKPMPVKAAEQFYLSLEASNQFAHEKQLQWLIDTPQRAKQYLELAKKQDVSMRFNIEIDVGLHRGGIQSTSEFDEIMTVILANPKHLSFSGFMGYDPQVVKFPEIVKSVDEAFTESQAHYHRFVDHITAQYPQIDVSGLCLNGAGSPTIPLHQSQKTILNDVTAGSCLVKPTQFDIPGLEEFGPAAHIATPILKKMAGTNIPGLEGLKDLQGKWDPNRQQTLFIYGGKWKAHYESPQGLVGNDIYGTSTNQMIVNCSNDTNVNVDDHVFLRPDQSEFVFLQFGDLLVTRNGLLKEKWSILKDVS